MRPHAGGVGGRGGQLVGAVVGERGQLGRELGVVEEQMFTGPVGDLGAGVRHVQQDRAVRITGDEHNTSVHDAHHGWSRID